VIFMRRFLAPLLALCLAQPAIAQDRIEVDLELVLMVDVSRSMTPGELEIQRRGYAAALRSEDVFRAVQSGLLQTVAVTYVEWAGTQNVVVDWRLLQTRADLLALADTLSSSFNPALRRTSISEAIVFGARSIDQNIYEGLRKVIDISGDGPNNQGRPVTRARDDAVAQGIIINGLPLMTREGMGSQWYLEDLDIYYETCVTGGPGSFVLPVTEWDQFAQAVRRKLVLEMVGLPLPRAPMRAQADIGAQEPIPVQSPQRDPRDCMIGEKIREERQRIWGEP
jgi:hypothetical protein